MSVYVTLLRENPPLRRLSTIQLLCYFATWFSHMAIFTLLIQLHAPVWALSMAAAFGFLPSMLLAPFSGALIDRLPTKRLMLVLTSIEIVTVFVLMWIDSLVYMPLLLVLIFIRMGAGSIYFQTEMALLPKLLDPQSLKIANELHSIIWSLSYAAGMAIAGIYIHIFGTTSAFVADMVFYSIALGLLWGLNIPSVATASHRVQVMIREGYIYLRDNPKVVHLMFLHASVGFTAYDALVALLADYHYKELLSASLVMGWINAVRAISLVLGQMVLGRFINTKNLFYLLLAQGVGIGVWAMLQSDFYLSFIGVFLCGLFTTTLWSYTYTLLQYETDAAFYGRVIAYNDMLFMGVGTGVSLGIGWLFEKGLALSVITALLAVAFVGYAFYWRWIHKHFTILH